MLGMEKDIKTAPVATKEGNEESCYELGYLLLPSIAGEAIPETLEAIKGIITRAGGAVTLSNLPVSISLSYSIYRKEGGKNTEFTRAYFGFMHFSMESGALLLVKKEIEAMSVILRALFISDPNEPIHVTGPAAEATPHENLSKKESTPLDDAALDRELADILIS